MLKLNYTEAGLYMERLMTPLEMLISERVMLALRLGQTLHVEPGRASFLIPVNTPKLVYLEMAFRQTCNLEMTIERVDDEFVEISLSGNWIAESAMTSEGTFLTVLPDRAELLVYMLWQAAQIHQASLA